MFELPEMNNPRFTPESGYRVIVQVPQPDCERILAAVLKQDPLEYSDYDQVAFNTSQGTQVFRSMPGGHNPVTTSRVEVPCVELSFFTLAGSQQLARIIEAIYYAHPYEEPVIQIMPALRIRHVRGMDEDNPNRFWNRPDAD